MEDLVGFDSLHLGVAKESRFVRHRMHLFSFSFPVLKLHLYFSLSGVGLGPRDWRFPLLRLLPFEMNIFFYVVAQLLFLLLIASISRSVFLLLMDELSRAVAQFYSALGGNGGLGGMNGGFNPPPMPNNSPILAAASHEAGPPEAEARGRAPRDLVSELRSDPYLCTTFRNACIKQEEIIKQVSDLALANQVPIDDPQDIRRGAETYLTNLMCEEPRSRNVKLARILRDLTTRGSTSRHYTAILQEISALNGW